MVDMETFYKQFCKEGFDENGVLNFFEPVIADNFNFAYDVVDEIARLEPNRRAMIWCNVAGEERVLGRGSFGGLQGVKALAYGLCRHAATVPVTTDSYLRTHFYVHHPVAIVFG